MTKRNNITQEGVEESEKYAEAPNLERNYTTPIVLPEVRSRTSSSERTVNTGSTSVATTVQGSPPSLNFPLNNPDTDRH